MEGASARAEEHGDAALSTAGLLETSHEELGRRRAWTPHARRRTMVNWTSSLEGGAPGG